MASGHLRTEDIGFTRNEQHINAYAAWVRRDEHLPAVIIVHDVFGLGEHYRDIARRFAEEGFFALAIDLYSREGAPQLPTAEAAVQWMRQLNDGRVLADLDAAGRFLRTRIEVRPGSIGITGFCMGGRYAFMAACAIPDLAACVSFYGPLRVAEKPLGAFELAADLHCPFLGLYGEQDALIPRADIKELESILRRAEKTFKTKIYPDAGHAFFNDRRPDAYKPTAAQDAWQRTLKFFRTHLAT
ncbi:MAG: dienelactone hydrolase family protein [Candidatus Binatia bacterium]